MVQVDMSSQIIDLMNTCLMVKLVFKNFVLKTAKYLLTVGQPALMELCRIIKKMSRLYFNKKTKPPHHLIRNKDKKVEELYK